VGRPDAQRQPVSRAGSSQRRRFAGQAANRIPSGIKQYGNVPLL